ncbi:hypothetical protein [Paractinoplanes maris]|uniref:hypothetical protein n=1 Tax=Paractinoplanes maris TaxID=1734446 RepID=UPI002021588A|nr:hypothetical protein [Actinoplanes maris]
MPSDRVHEQHIAMFGESGSGKTVLLSSFYGATQEPQYLRKQLFDVLPDDIGQGRRLHQNYLGMRDSARPPAGTKFAATAYSFSVKLKDSSDDAAKARPFDALRLVWHDYPGEWFGNEVSGPEEAQRRIDTFKSLLGSDVAFLLVDAQRLLDNAGEEERYLKSLLTSFRTTMLLLKDDLLEDGKPLVTFPRIWIMALSKADLMPDMDVYKFRDLLVGKVGEEMDELREALARLVEAGDALSVGEDFVLFSSAKFEPGKIEVSERVGLELILPLAAILPFERHVRWNQTMQIPGKVAETLVGSAGVVAAALLARTKNRLPGRLGQLANLFSSDAVLEAARLAGDKLRKMNAEALAKGENLAATLTGFRLDLVKGEEDEIFLRSRR